MELPLIKNKKTVNPRDGSSAPVFQLETAMGSAIECFDGAAAVVVPRTRFAPVKTTRWAGCCCNAWGLAYSHSLSHVGPTTASFASPCSDLFVLRSDVFTITPAATVEAVVANVSVMGLGGGVG